MQESEEEMTEAISRRRIEELLTIPCCHVSGEHDLQHQYVCSFQMRGPLFTIPKSPPRNLPEPVTWEKNITSNKPKKSVILPWPGDVTSALCALGSLGRRGIGIIAISSNRHAAEFYSGYVSERFLIPPYETSFSRYEGALVELCKREDVLTVLPFSEVDAYILSTHKSVLENHIKTIWVSNDTFEYVRDRLSLLKVAEDVGVPVPKTSIMSEWDDWSSPCLIKSRYSIMVANGRAFYGGVRFPETSRSPDQRSIVHEMKHEPIVQEYIPGGDEYGFSALFNNGQVRAKFQHRRLLSGTHRFPYIGGPSVLRKSVYIKELDEIGIKLLETLNWHGPAMVEFIYDSRDKQFKLLEVNPRFWGSLSLAVNSGVDFPYLYYQLAAKGDCDPVLGYKVNIVSHDLAGEFHCLMDMSSRRKFGPRYMVKPSLAEEILLIIKNLGGSKFDSFDRHDTAPLMIYLCSRDGKRLMRMIASACDLLLNTCLIVEEHLCGPPPIEGKLKEPRIRILFICYGNVCRSVIAEGILRSLLMKNHLLDKVYVDSAGTSARNAGSRPYWQARKCLRKRGINVSNHRARQFTQKDFHTFDRIVVMDRLNLADVLWEACGKEDEEKVFLLSRYAADTSLDEVPDPLGNPHISFDEVCDLIEEGCKGLLADVIAPGQNAARYEPDWNRILHELSAGEAALVKHDPVTVEAAIKQLEESGKIRPGEFEVVKNGMNTSVRRVRE